MNRYTIEHNGQRFTVEAGSPDEAMSFVAGQGQASPQPQAEPEGPPAPSREALSQAKYDALPWYGKAGQAADDVVRLTANNLTFGFADKLAGYMAGKDAKDERLATQDARDRAGWAGTAAEIAGGVAGAGGIAKAGLTAAKGISQAGLFGRMGAGAIDGAGLGALNAVGHNDNPQMLEQDVALQGLLGAGLGAAAPAVVAGVRGIGNAVSAPFRAKPAIPTADELKTAANAAYKRAEDAGDVLMPDAISGLRDRVKTTFAERGFHPGNEPGAANAISELDRLVTTGQPVTLKGMEVARRVAGNSYVPGNKSNNAMTYDVIREIDDLVNKSGTTGGAAMKEARELWSRSAKSDALETAMTRAEQRAAASGSGGNADNAMRQEARKLLDRGRGYSPDERAALEQVIAGTPDQNVMRLIGKMSPQGNGLMLMLQGLGGYASGGATLPLAIAGTAAKSVADRATARNVEELRKIILAGGSREAATGPTPAALRFIDDNRNDLARTLLMGGFATARGQ